jgi:hypothetical protein
MRHIIETLLSWSASAGGAERLAELAGKGTVWLAAAGATVLALRRAGAAARHLVWALALGGLLILPAAGALLPPLRGAWTSAPTGTREFAVVMPPPAGRAAVPPSGLRETAVLAPESPMRGAAPTEWRRPRWPGLAVPLWGLGVLLVLGSLTLSLIRVGRLRRSSRIETGARWRELVREVSAELGLRRPVTLLRSTGPAMPMTWGAWRPAVLLPAEADRWPAARCRDVLRHELAHVRRGDWAIQLVASLACALHWFNPLVWIAARALRTERERACDDQVLRAGTKPSDYAGHLLDIARALRTDAALAGLTLARPARLEGRLLDVLDAGRPRSGVTQRQLAAAACCAVALALPLGAAAPSAVEAAQLPARAAAALPDEAPMVALAAVTGGRLTPGARAVTPVAGDGDDDGLLADTLPECVGEEPRGRERHSVHVDDGVAVTTTVGRCWLRFVAERTVEFTDDFTDVARIASGGHVALETDNGDVLRRLEIHPRGDSLERRYTVNGAERPYDAEARRWVAGALTVMFRSSGIAAEERAAWILARQGPAGLLAELSELHGDYTRRRYAQYALARGGLDAAGQARLLQWAGRSIVSDYELAELLITAARGPLAPPVQMAFVAAAGTLESDYERGRVLSTALARADLDARGAAAVLETALGIESDYELAQLLIQWQRGRALDASLRPAFFRAAGSLQSDYEHRRVLAAVVGRGSASEAVVADALASARGIESDYEVAELLTAVAELYALGATVRPAYVAALSTLQSDHERGRALKALVDRADLDEATLLSVVTAAGDIESDYERTEVLIAVARRHRLDGAVLAAFMEAARGLGEYEYNRVMGALGRRGRAPI